ncbi:UPF0454 protein C12orf49 homolog [Belonocnema kinseyi]|uniref:UPF0454 protein C12orf49 homolog n=1 Tax=Belonocnema kinseyi TaxID=2817044 RepID=UPI00143DA3E0|nr:UPF0454 protein C12orf49 homolog [Belonocnema kinseyi]XP_033209751.1 UPF0454 protein C12orf49 homolog [Belonocnema kinseyi]
MPILANLIRLFRRRMVLGLIFGLSLTYCAVSLLRHEGRGISLENDFEDINDNEFLNENEENSDEQVSMKSLIWEMDVLNDENADSLVETNAPGQGNNSESLPANCRNSIQGKVFIVDEKGYVCYRKDILGSGCCNRDLLKPSRDNISTSVKRYSCETCNTAGCCAIYEYCVSCCLHPGKHRLKGKRNADGEEVVVRKEEKKNGKNFDMLKARLRGLDRFQYCLAACRTSSASVRHENTYKNPHSKHCYTLHVPSPVLHNKPPFKDI